MTFVTFELLATMMYPHVIRLRNPWDRTVCDDGALHSRRFNSPTGLDVREQVWVVVEGLQLAARIACNGNEVGQVTDGNESGEFNITGCLKSRNDLQIKVAGGDHAQEQAVFDSVRLEIRLGPAR